MWLSFELLVKVNVDGIDMLRRPQIAPFADVMSLMVIIVIIIFAGNGKYAGTGTAHLVLLI